MPRSCQVCEHPKREDIDRALLRKESSRNIAKQFRLGRMSVQRHAETHMPIALITAREVSVAAAEGTLRTKLEQVVEDARRITLRAEQAGQLSVALAGLRTLTNALELFAKITGELEPSPPATQLNVVLLDDLVRRATEVRANQDAIDVQPQPLEVTNGNS